MGTVGAKIKVLPNSPDSDIDKIKDEISKLCNVQNFEVKPFVFGMKAIFVTLTVDDGEGGIDSIIEKIEKIEDVSSVEVEAMGRLWYFENT